VTAHHISHHTAHWGINIHICNKRQDSKLFISISIPDAKESPTAVVMFLFFVLFVVESFEFDIRNKQYD
jgi:hypothetical protein